MELSGTITTKVRNLENRKKADYRTWKADEKRKEEEQEMRKEAEWTRLQEEARRRQEEEDRLAAQLLG
jgi:hypothetical protein